MGFLDSIKADQLGKKAYRTHVTAMQMRRQGKYQEAERKLDDALKMYDDAYAQGFRRATAVLGYCILRMQRVGDFERVREMMLELSKDKSLSQDDRYTLRVNYSVCQWKLGKLDKAIETIRSAAQTKMNGQIYTTLGMYLVDKARETGVFDEALQFNQEAMEYDDEDPATLDNMGQLYIMMSDRARADGDAEKAAQLRGEALAYLKKAHELKPDQITTDYWLAKLMHEDGEDAAAREMIDMALELSFSKICPVTREEMEKLRGEIG